MIRILCPVLLALLFSCRESSRSSQPATPDQASKNSTQLEGVRFQWVGSQFTRCELSSGHAVRRSLIFLAQSELEWLEEGMEDEACRNRDKSPELRLRGRYTSLSFMEGTLQFADGSAGEWNGARYRLGNMNLRVSHPDSSKGAQIYLYRDKSAP